MPVLQQYKIRMWSKNKPSAFQGLRRIDRNQRLQSLSRATTCKVRVEGGGGGGGNFRFHFTRGGGKNNRSAECGLMANLPKEKWEDNQKQQVVFFSLHCAPSSGYYITNIAARYGCALHQHTFTAGRDRLIWETWDPPKEHFLFILDNPQPHQRRLFQL